LIPQASRLLTGLVGFVTVVALVSCSGQSAGPPMPERAHRPTIIGQGSCDSSIVANFNGTPIAAGNTIWFSAVMKVQGLSATTKTTINLTAASITFTANGTPYSVAVPDSAVTFDPAATSANVSFDPVANRWNENLPVGLGGNVLLGAVELPLASELPGGINNVNWSEHFTSAPGGPTVNWQWGAAVYDQFSTDYNALGVKPVDDNNASQYKNSDHAGTPENFKVDLIGGAMGGGGSNFTGGLSGTATVSPCALWTTKELMPTTRYALGANVVNRILYAVGGVDVGGASLNTVEAYNSLTDSWTSKAPLPTADCCMATGVVNGILYAAGGSVGPSSTTNILQAYDPVANAWTTKAPMPTARYFTAAGVVNGILYVVGGYNGSFLDTVEAYNPSSDSWTAKKSLPTARYALVVGVVNGILYAVGGASSGGIFNTVEAYNPSTDSWTTKAPMPTARYLLAAGVVDGILYAVGGVDSGNNTVSTVEAYNPLTDTWTTKASMPTARNQLTAGVASGTLYVVGGNTPGGIVNTNEAYTP